MTYSLFLFGKMGPCPPVARKPARDGRRQGRADARKVCGARLPPIRAKR